MPAVHAQRQPCRDTAAAGLTAAPFLCYSTIAGARPQRAGPWTNHPYTTLPLPRPGLACVVGSDPTALSDEDEGGRTGFLADGPVLPAAPLHADGWLDTLTIRQFAVEHRLGFLTAFRTVACHVLGVEVELFRDRVASPKGKGPASLEVSVWRCPYRLGASRQTLRDAVVSAFKDRCVSRECELWYALNSTGQARLQRYLQSEECRGHPQKFLTVEAKCARP